ncbi:MAG: hypothetical protein GY820_23445 [Gammaproteobacteria bacterium]|nr:hypothetical protein [Gammaproteobacteria bacterium]
MATPPYWENKRLNKEMRDFLANNHPQRLAQFDKDQEEFLALRKSWAGKDPMKRFILAYKYRRAMFFRYPNQFPIGHCQV